MRTIPLGKTGLAVPAVALGCMRLTALDERGAQTYVRTALEYGANFFDHADIYGDGACEEIFAKAAHMSPSVREKLILQSKCGIVKNPRMFDFSRRHIIESVEGSLRRLGTEYLDVLLLHTPAGEAAQAAPEPEEAPADEDAEIFAAARAWDAAEEAEQKARKRARAKWKEGLLWLLTLALMVILPNLTYWLGISEVYAVVVTVAFLITGFLLDNWHPGWMLFLTIPLYYVLIFGR